MEHKIKPQDYDTKIFDKLIQAYRDQVLFWTQVFRCHKVFWCGQETMEEEPRSDITVTSWIETNAIKVKTVIRSDRRLTMRRRLNSDQLIFNLDC